MQVKWMTAGVLVLCLAAPAAEAGPYDTLEFTAVVTDPVDQVGFLDILEFALAETGSDELVLRIKFTAGPAATGTLSQVMFYNVAGTNYGSGMGDSGAPAGNTNVGPGKPSSCLLDGAYGYCIVPYSLFSGSVGTVIDTPYGLSYAGVAQDYAPTLGGFAVGTALATRGTPYTLTGCTVKGGCGAVLGSVPPTIHYVDLSDPLFKAGFDNATGSYVYNMTNARDAVDLTYAFNVTAGTARMVVREPSGQVLANESFSQSGGDRRAIMSGANGTWQVQLQVAGFTGTADVALSPPQPALGTGTNATTTTSSTGTIGATNATDSSSSPTTSTTTSKGTPLPLTAGLLGLVYALMRRRR